MEVRIVGTDAAVNKDYARGVVQGFVVEKIGMILAMVVTDLLVSMA